MKSIKELSEEFNISKISIYRLLKKPEFQHYVTKERNTLYVGIEGESALKEHFIKQCLIKENCTSEDNIKDDSTEKKEQAISVSEINENEVERETEMESIEVLDNNYNYYIIEQLRGQIREKENRIREIECKLKEKDMQLKSVLELLRYEYEKDTRLINNGIIITEKPEVPLCEQSSQSQPKGLLKRIFSII